MTDTPQHIRLPVAFHQCSDGQVKLATVDQGSPDHVRSQVVMVASFPIGSRDELPGFGITPLVFQAGDLRLDVLKAQIERWVAADLTAQETAEAATIAQRTVHLGAGS